MPRPRFTKLPEERQLQILDVAAKEFALTGYHDTSFNRIMEETGVSKGAMYYYFNDKLDLYRTVILRMMKGSDHLLWSKPLEVSSITMFWNSLSEAYIRVMEYFMERPQELALYKGVWLLKGSEGSQTLTDVFAHFEKWERHLLTVGQAHGYIRLDLPFELLLKIVMGIAAAFDDWMVHETADALPTKEDIQNMLDMQLAVVRDFLTIKS